MMEELDLKQMIKYIYKKKNIFISILLISILLGMIYTFLIKKPIYEVTAQILIDKADASIEEFVISKDVLKERKIGVTFDKATKLIHITTKRNTAEESFSLTNQYIEELRQKLEETYAIKTFSIIETPQFPEQANTIECIQDIGIFAFIGLVLYVVYIMVRLGMRGVMTSSEIENGTKMKVLGTISLEKKKEKTKLYEITNKKISEELKRTEVNITLNKENREPQTILVTGAKCGVGTTYIAKNLANQYAKIYEKVLLIDTDILEKTLTTLYKKQEEKGISNLLKENKTEEIEKLITKTEKEHISFLPVGTEKTEEFFLQPNRNAIFQKLKETYDIILIDTLSINQKTLPLVLASMADATVIVAETEKTKMEDLIKAKVAVENVGGKVSGVILNKAI